MFLTGTTGFQQCAAIIEQLQDFMRAGARMAITAFGFGLAAVPVSAAVGRGRRRPLWKGDPGAASIARRARRQKNQRFAAIGTFTGSGGALGMVVTRPLGGVVVAAAGWVGVAISPSAFRTSVSNLVITSLLSLRNWRAFSRPCPIRSPL